MLDNYHSGFVGFLVEFGLFGFALLAAFVVALCRRLAAAVASAPLTPRKDRFATEATLGVLVLLFTIILTESFFTRATDFSQIMTTFLTISLFAHCPVPHPERHAAWAAAARSAPSHPEAPRPAAAAVGARTSGTA